MTFSPIFLFYFIYLIAAQHSSNNLQLDRPTSEDAEYPAPPVNLTANTIYGDKEVKILQTTVNWDFEPVDASDDECETDFPGYSNENIGRFAHSHTIPLEMNDHDNTELEINHDCTYDIRLRSLPYSVNDEDSLARLRYTVPHCIDGYCNCKGQDIPTAKNVSAFVFRKDEKIRAEVFWSLPEALDTRFVYYIELFEKPWIGHNDVEDKDEMRESGMVEQRLISERNKTAYSMVLPTELERDREYAAYVYVMNRHLCHSSPTVHRFSASPGNATEFEESLRSGANQENLNQPLRAQTATELRDEAENSAVAAVASSQFAFSPSTITVVWIAVALAVLLACAACVFILRKYCSRRKKSEIEKSSIIPWAMAHSSHSVLETNILYRRAGDAKSKELVYEIPSNQIQVGAVIGQGAFGMVCMGTVMGLEGFGRPTTVAVKQLNANAEDFQKTEFTAEIEIMKQVGRHSNVVAMYGYCVEPSHQCMIMEYVPFGDLKHYLHGLRKQFDLAVFNMKSSSHKWEGPESLPPSLHSSFISTSDKSPFPNCNYYLDLAELQSFACQVACGMAHIESLGIVHRDLAARNILVGRGKQLKISDFGLSRRGVYVKTSKGIIPLRWLSIEAIEHNLYSTKSDIWAYGVVLWEICTLAGFPYAKISDKELLKHLQRGNRLEKPSSCANEIYDVMTKCWAEEPTERPSFGFLAEYLNDLNSQECPYVEFLPDEELPPPGKEIPIDSVSGETPLTMSSEVCQSTATAVAVAS